MNAIDHQGRTPFHLMCMTRCKAEILEIRDFEGKSTQDLTHTRDLMEIERKMDFKERERNGFKCYL